MLWNEILGGFVIAGFFGNADAASLVGSVIAPKRTGSLSDHRECAHRPYYRHAVVRLFG
jgi:hypothetical protein